MCNLYRMTKPSSEVASWLDAVDAAGGANYGEEIYPGTPGIVVAAGAVRAMTWGFPLALTGAKGQPLKPKPVNNARTDKLTTGFWRQSFDQRRCLIPLTAWAEAEGARGRMTRTWMALPGAPLIVAAGVWRRSDRWGDCYAMVMTDSAGSDAAAVHSRMPVLFALHDHKRWLTAPSAEALLLCQPWGGALSINRTAQPWAKSAAPALGEQPSLI